MIHAFGEYRMDVDARELRRGEAVVPLEPQVFDLLRVLIENRQRVVGRDELIERIWGGRIVSDAAVSSRIKSARQAIGDDGKRQAMIRTLHGVGFRFVGVAGAAPVSRAAGEPEAQPLDEAPPAHAAPSIAVLPFRLVGVGGPYAAIADGLAHDLIVELARLRWLTVIARESSFQLRNATSEKVKAALGVRYALTGVVEIVGGQLTVTIEVSRTDDDAIIWSEVYRGEVGAVHEMRAEIASATVAALDLQIPFAEARRRTSTPGLPTTWAWPSSSGSTAKAPNARRPCSARRSPASPASPEPTPDFRSPISRARSCGSPPTAARRRRARGVAPRRASPSIRSIRSATWSWAAPAG
jgi:TolB-like protein